MDTALQDLVAEGYSPEDTEAILAQQTGQAPPKKKKSKKAAKAKPASKPSPATSKDADPEAAKDEPTSGAS